MYILGNSKQFQKKITFAKTNVFDKPNEPRKHAYSVVARKGGM